MRTYKSLAIRTIMELCDVLRSMYLTLGDEPKQATLKAEKNICLRLGLCIDQLHALMNGEDI